MQSYCNLWESLSAMCPMWEERQEFRKATRCSVRARPRSAASLSSGVETESDSSDASGVRRTVCKQSKEQGRENRAAGERGPGSACVGSSGLPGARRDGRCGTRTRQQVLLPCSLTEALLPFAERSTIS